MRLSFLIFAVILTAPLHVLAQQEIQHTQYLLNYYLLNPALAGSQASYDIMLGYRHQWTGLDGAPTTSWLSVHKSINYPRANVRRRRGHHGAGGFLVHDQAGPFRRTQAYLTYAYHLPLSKKYTISAGVSGGLKQIGIDKDQVAFVQSPNDDYFNGYASEQTEPDGSIGVWLYSSRLFAGVSAQQLFSLLSEDQNAEANLPSVSLARHYYATLGYQIAVDRDISFIPSFMIKTAYAAPPQIDVNMKLRYQKRIWAGLSYRHQDAIAVVVGTLLREKLTLSYAYDASVTRLSSASSGSHEVVLGLKLPPRGKVVCPDQFW
jgi:type IX secretion system PorP/SprF family membrane protein